MTSVMLQPSERRVAVSATKLLISNPWIMSESGKTFANKNRIRIASHRSTAWVAPPEEVAVLQDVHAR